tara:strand:- start:3923 stop:4504 length:582 start_codon:yes stop_codon:yes gene_type:complete
VKKIIQIILVIILILIITIFYLKYFKQDDKSSDILKSNNLTKNINETENNIIKNLNYKIKIKQNNSYQISSELNEMLYKDGVEFVLMERVSATLEDNENNTIFINSDKATYNSDNFKTIFEDNIQINYLTDKIYADKMVLDFEKNLITLMNNIRYVGLQSTIEADNLEINLISKKVNIFMNNSNEDVIISSYK